MKHQKHYTTELIIIESNENQVGRIKIKLEKAKHKDKDFSVFGSSSHKYKVNDTITKEKLKEWERVNQVLLPEDFFRFLTEVGNGGAGPYYGVYEIDKILTYTSKNALAAKCVLYPKMPKEEWNRLTEPLTSDENISDDEYDSARDKVFGGMLCFGTQGCEYDMYIVLTGEYKGRVVYTWDFYPDGHPFFFVYENNFLDWYERWLNEIILGYETSWFGNKMPGNENELVLIYQNAEENEIKSEALDGMFKFCQISQTTINFLIDIIEQKQHRTTALQILCKNTFETGSPYLMEQLKSVNDREFLNALKILWWYGKNSDLEKFQKVIHKSLHRIRDVETLRFAGYVMHSYDKISIEDFKNFLCHPDPQIRGTAIYATRDCSDKEKKIEIIEQMLLGDDKDVMRDYILYWGLVPHSRLLPYYKTAWPDYKDIVNLSKKFYECLEIMKMPIDSLEP